MQKFFIKKYIFTAILLVLWLGFSGLNIAMNLSSFSEIKQDAMEVKTVEDIRKWTSTVESTISDNLIAHSAFIESFGYIQKLLDKKEFNNFSYFTDDNDSLYYATTWNNTEHSDIETYAKRIKRAADYAISNGMKPLIVLAPSKMLPSMSSELIGMPINDTNARLDKLIVWLHYLNVPALDLRIAMEESGLSPLELFIRTDHHWTPAAAFIATQEIAKTIKSVYNHDLDPQNYYLNLDNYNSHTYFNSSQGSVSKNAGYAYAGADDYTLLWPKFKTNFSWKNEDTEDEGAFEQSLIRTEHARYDNTNLNNLYIEQISDYDTIKNLKDTDKPTLTVLRDSYFSPVACFLAPMFSQIDMMYLLNKDSSPEKFIRNAKSDYFIIEVYPHNLDDKAFNFFKEK